MPQTSAPARYRLYVLALLTLVYFFYLVDRNAIVVTQHLIKQEYGLSDTELGLITGTLYGVAYAAGGLPLGWAVDRVNRRDLLVAAMAIWSGLTSLCGLGLNFTGLALARVGIGAAESAGSPAALSILSDLFPPARRGMITSVFYSGAGLGAIASFLLGGFLAANYGWRAVFVIYGLPGLLIALLILFTVKEPMRSLSPSAARGNLLKDCGSIMRLPGLIPLYTATALFMISVAGVGTWIIPFLIRSHSVDLVAVGMYAALGSGLFGFIGVIATGALFDFARRWGTRGPLTVVAVGAMANLAFGCLVLFSDSLFWAVVGLCGVGATASVNAGPTNAAISELTPSHLRGLAFALYAVIANVVGVGLGPLIVGMISDALGSDGEALRWSMAGVLSIELAAAGAFLFAARSFAAALGPVQLV